MKCKHGIRDTSTNLPYCRFCDNESKAKPKECRVELKGGVSLSVDEAKEALEAALPIVESIGTVDTGSYIHNARNWLRAYFPNWAD